MDNNSNQIKKEEVNQNSANNIQPAVNNVVQNNTEKEAEPVKVEDKLKSEVVTDSNDNSNKIGYVGGIVAIVLVIVGYFFFFNEDNTLLSEIVDVKVRLGWVHQAQFAGFYVAKEKGFYKEVGLDVELLPADFSINQNEEVASGDIDFSVMEAHQFLGDPENAIAVATIYQINPHVLATRIDSGIRTPDDFVGKTVGLAGGMSEGSAIFQIFIDDTSGPDSVVYKDLGFETVDDFINNSADIIDVYRTDQPFLATKRGVPLHIIPLDAYGLSTYGDIIVANKDLIENDPDTVSRFVKSTLKGLEYALSNPNEAVDISMIYAEGDYADREYQEHIFFGSIPLMRGDTTVLGSMDLVPWSTLYESMLRVGAIEGSLDIRDVYTNKFTQ